MAFTPNPRRPTLTYDDIAANHGRYDSRGTGLSILGQQFDQRRRDDYFQDAAQQPGYTEHDRAADMGLKIRNDMDAAGPWGGFFGRMGAQEAEATASGKRFAQVGRGTPMPGYASGGGSGNTAALRAMVSDGGGGLDPRIERDSTALILKQLEAQLAGPRVGSHQNFSGGIDEFVIDPAAVQREDVRRGAVANAATADTLDRQYGNTTALRHALTAEDVAGIKAQGDINRYMLPGMDFIRENEMAAKTAPVRLQGESNERIAAQRAAADLGVADNDLAGREMQYRSSAMQELVKLLQGYQEGAPVSPERIKDPNVKSLLDFIMRLAPGGR